MESMHIDDERIHVLTKYTRNGKTKSKTVTDHNILYAKFDRSYIDEPKPVRKEVFNYRSEKGRELYQQETSIVGRFSSCFKSSENFHRCANKFFKTFKDTLFKCFGKVRVTKRSKPKILGNCQVQEIMNNKKKMLQSLTESKCLLAKNILTNKIEDCDDRLMKLSKD